MTSLNKPRTQRPELPLAFPGSKSVIAVTGYG
jgi:hypothetical protein